MTPSQSEVTQLLAAWSDGDRGARDKLIPLVYAELRRVAAHYMRTQAPGHTLQTTALIHEAFLKLAGRPEKHWNGRAHFLGVAAQAMRHILVDHARAQDRAKRGGGVHAVSLEECGAVPVERAAELVALDEALDRLAAIDPRKARVVEMRYFGGLSVDEVAELLVVSPDTVMRDWRLAKTWLRRELSHTEET
jgi:RNA polymerase sigma factor (TIGR02999 family)